VEIARGCVHTGALFDSKHQNGVYTGSGVAYLVLFGTYVDSDVRKHQAHFPGPDTEPVFLRQVELTIELLWRKHHIIRAIVLPVDSCSHPPQVAAGKVLLHTATTL